MPKQLFQKGYIPWNKGKEMSEETKEKIRKKMKGRKLSAKHIESLENKEFSITHRKNISKAKSREHHHFWKGGKRKDSRGYILILKPEHPFNYKYVPEHRLVVEKEIGRYLLPTEEVHHRNKKRDDNHKENLITFVSKSAHQRFERGGEVKPEEIIYNGRL